MQDQVVREMQAAKRQRKGREREHQFALKYCERGSRQSLRRPQATRMPDPERDGRPEPGERLLRGSASRAESAGDVR